MVKNQITRKSVDLIMLIRYSFFATAILLNFAALSGLVFHPIWEVTIPDCLFRIDNALLAVTLLACILSAMLALYYLGAHRQEKIRSENGKSLINATWTLLYSAIALGAAYWTLWNVRIDGVLTWPDTEDYAMIASQTWYSKTFWTGGNAPVLPLLFKVFGLNWDTFISPGYEEIARKITFAQTAISFLSISFLAFSFGSVIRVRWLRLVSVLVVFALGASIDVAQWNRMLLSESLSTSLFFVILGGMLLLTLDWLNSQGWPVQFARGSLTLALLLAVALFAFTRDVNSYFLFAAGVPGIIVVLRANRHQSRRKWTHLVILTVMVLAGTMSAFLRQGRWSYPFINIVYDRILSDPVATEFFVQHGFPLNVIERIQPDSRHDLHVGLRSEEAEPYWTWFDANARAVHTKFLLLHPIYSLTAPIQDLPRLINPNIDWYRVRVHPEPSWLRGASRLLFSHSAYFLVIWLLIVGSNSIILLFRGRGKSFWLIPLVLLFTLYPLYLVIWHGDTAAMDRHALPVALSLRLALWLITLFLIDELIHKTANSTE
jgi:hypothetical protein